MRTAQEIQLTVFQLLADELARFGEWFDKYNAEVWDRNFGEDAKSGKLNRYADQAIADCSRSLSSPSF